MCRVNAFQSFPDSSGHFRSLPVTCVFLNFIRPLPVTSGQFPGTSGHLVAGSGRTANHVLCEVVNRCFFFASCIVRRQTAHFVKQAVVRQSFFFFQTKKRILYLTKRNDLRNKMAGTSGILRPEPLAECFSCPVCFEDLQPAFSFPCNHKICGNCAANSLSCCVLCRVVGKATMDHAFGAAVQHMQATRNYRCSLCDAVVSSSDVTSHMCVTQEETLVKKFTSLATASCVPLDTLRFLVHSAIECVDGDGDGDIEAAVTDMIAEEGERLSHPPAVAAPALSPVPTLLAGAARTDSAGGSTSAPRHVAIAASTPAIGNPSWKSDAVIYIDFDQFALEEASNVERLVIGVQKKVVSEGLAPNTACIHVVAFGVSFSFRNDKTTHIMQILGVEMRLVSARKAEETDRTIEREAGSSGATVVVLVSGDQDFIPLGRTLVRQGKTFVCVHGAEEGSARAARLSLHPTMTWRYDQVAPGWTPTIASGKKGNHNAKMTPRSTSPATTATGTSASGKPNKSATHAGAFVALATAATWQTDFCTVSLADGRRATLPRRSYRGDDSSSDMMVVVAPNPMSPQRLLCLAGCDVKQSVTVDGQPWPLQALKVTVGLLMTIATGDSHATLKFCASGDRCTFGDKCNFVHPAPTRLTPPPPLGVCVATPVHPTNSVSTVTSTSAAACKFGQGCTRGASCPYTHPAPTSSASSAANVPCKFGQGCTRGASCPYAHPTTIASTPSAGIAACKFGQGCTRGASCPYIHQAPPASVVAQSSSSGVPCKFGAKCNRPNCPYSHSSW